MGLHVRPTLGVDFSQTPTLPDASELAAVASFIRMGRCALFVGAGLSVPAKLPTWKELMQGLIGEISPWSVDSKLFPPTLQRLSLTNDPKESLMDPLVRKVMKEMGPERFRSLCRRFSEKGKKPGASEVLSTICVVRKDSMRREETERLLSQGRYLELAGQCRAELGSERFHALVKEALRPMGKLPETHNHIVRTPFSCVVTTNFDDLLERAYALWHRAGIPPAPTGTELSEHGTLLLDRAFFILKAHGDATMPDSMVFTADDYRRVIHANPAFQAIMSGILMSHAMLFVGYSLSDANFRLLLDSQLTIFNGNVPPRYALMGGVGETEREILWRTAKLRVIPYPRGKHEEVGNFLKNLALQSGGGTGRAPEIRAGKGKVAPRRGHALLAIKAQGTWIHCELAHSNGSGIIDRTMRWGGTWKGAEVMGNTITEAISGMQGGSGPLKSIRIASERLGSLLPTELLAAMRANPRGLPVHLDCSPETEAYPWEWIRLGKDYLCLEHPICRKPVAITNPARGFRRLGNPIRALLLGDTGIGDDSRDHGNQYKLPGASKEVTAIAEFLKKASPTSEITVLEGKQAQAERFIKEISEGDYDLIHFGGHAWSGHQESFLCLWDRVALGSEIAPLLSRRPPSIMVMDTHYTSFVPVSVETDSDAWLRMTATPGALKASGSPRGFTDLAMRCGITAFVGCFGSPADEFAADFVIAFYRELFKPGTDIESALLAARKATVGPKQTTGLFYTMSGHPEFKLIGK